MVCIVCSCQNKEQKVNPVSQRTEQQKQIAKWYDTAVSLRNKNHFQILNYADSIKKLNGAELPDYKALGYICYGLYYNAVNNDSLSFKSYNAALQLVKETKTDSLLASAHCGLGNYYKHTGDYVKATKSFLTALQFSEKQKDTMDIAAIYANLGQLYLQKDDQKQAKHYLTLAKQLLKTTKSDHRT